MKINMKIKTIDYYWWKRLGSIVYQQTSSRLFIPRGDINVFSVYQKKASLAFSTVAAYEKYWANLFKHISFVLTLVYFFMTLPFY